MPHNFVTAAEEGCQFVCVRSVRSVVAAYLTQGILCIVKQISNPGTFVFEWWFPSHGVRGWREIHLSQMVGCSLGL